MSLSLVDFLIGRRVSNREAEAHKLGVLQAIPAMGLDSLSSAAYGPEAALSILSAAGMAGLAVMTPVTAAIVILLVVLGASYWQTVEAYPTSGGAYVVAKENLGILPALLAATALMIDYTLNVAVGISTGVATLTSAVPALQALTLPLCLAVLAIITLLNLRGTREAGVIWAAPSYLYIVTIGCTLAWGILKSISGSGHPHAVVSPPPMPKAVEAISLWLLLRGFANGCTAMTGVEAVSNGVNALREPKVTRARSTLVFIVVVLGLMLLGIAYLSRAYGISAMDQTKPGYQTILSQLSGAVFGHEWFYYVTLTSVLWVVCLSANTSFVGFPRLCHLVAHDGFLPRAFAVPGRRLVYSVGILFLTAGSGGLLIIFNGTTMQLIPLFAVGAFLAFTLSQFGMAVHWWRAGEHGRGYAETSKLLINGVGAIATGIALVIILLTKFAEGAWITVILIPCTMLLLRRIRRYYDTVDAQLCADADAELELYQRVEPAVLVPIGGWNHITRKAVSYALRLSSDVTALHVTTLEGSDLDEQAQRLRDEWRRLVERPARGAGMETPSLRMVQSQYRSIVAPLLREIDAVRRRQPGRTVFVVIPQIVDGYWWELLLQTHRERHLRSRLIRYGGPDVAVVGVPWQLMPSNPKEGLAEEEPS
jgi:amino acid transporter